jgi:uncharacterized protein YjbI with pentapeptide repeats
MATYRGVELSEILRLHQEWLDSGGLSGVRADLHGADLAGADLEGANLAKAHLEGVHLEDANLTGAVLIWPRRGLPART